ncbi:hypothetical protein [Acinetobacter baumannii]|uniref:hypothetical protein n=1 Tax=Acinetobacter baumannii TaxID=470 RepID=UPI0032198531
MNMTGFSLTYLEHQTAPRFEHDIHQMYQRIRFKQGGDFDSKFWFDRLFAYFHDWSLLCMRMEFYSGIWIESFRRCYFASRSELPAPYTNQMDFEQYKARLIELILSKLVKIFSLPAILEEIKKKNEQHRKTVVRYQEEYDEATEHYYNLNKINLFLGYQPEYANNISIIELNEHIRSLIKYLHNPKYYPIDYLFQYQRIIRLPNTNEYGLLFSMTLNGNIYSDVSAMIQMIMQSWIWATQRQGMGIDLETEDAQKNHPLAFMFGEFDDQNDLESLLQRDIVSTTEDSINVRVWPVAFKHFIARAPKR